jgi:hypothetical protein
MALLVELWRIESLDGQRDLIGTREARARVSFDCPSVTRSDGS